MWFCLASLIVVAAMVQSHTWHWGRTCPFVPPFPDFSIDKILGSWFVVHKLNTEETCLVWDFETSTKNPDEELTLRKLEQFYSVTLNESVTRLSTEATIYTNPQEPARMRIRWPASWTGLSDFLVFDTDYENYIAIYQCDRGGFFHRRDVAILSKATLLDSSILRRIFSILYPIDHRLLKRIGHESCQVDGKSEKERRREDASLRASLAQFMEAIDTSQAEELAQGMSGPEGSFVRIPFT